MGNYVTITNNRSDKQRWQGRPWKFLDPFNTWTVYKLLLQTKMSQYNMYIVWNKNWQKKYSSQRWWCIYFLTKILSKIRYVKQLNLWHKKWDVIFLSMENFSAWFSKNIKDSKIVCTILSKLPVWTSKPAPCHAATVI